MPFTLCTIQIPESSELALLNRRFETSVGIGLFYYYREKNSMRKVSLVFIFLCINMVYAISQEKNMEIKQLPADSLILEKMHNNSADEKGFNVVKTETIPYPKSWSSLTEAQKQLRLLNMLSKISTQKGITYISRRSGYKPKMLFESSSYIDSPDVNKRNILKDPVYKELPKQLVQYAEQKDSTFGDNIYKHEVTCTDKETMVQITNCSTMKYHGITCINAEELALYLSVMQSPTGIILSSGVTVHNHPKNIKILFMSVDIADSFSRRIDALGDWYKQQLSLE